MASPRCQSRDSSTGGGRSPSADSNYSDRNSVPPSGSAATSPIGMSLPATLPPAAAAALLPQQHAAMAAYLGAAAVAAQQNRLLMGAHPLGLGRGGSPPMLPMTSPLGGDTPVLDFSTKRKSQDFDDRNRDRSTPKSSASPDAVNLSRPDNAPLDLTMSRKRNNSSPTPPPAPLNRNKMARPMDYKPPIVSPWTSPMTPYFAAAVAAAGLSPKANPQSEWNGTKSKMNATNDATKALEKMSELSRLGGNEVGRQSATSSGNTAPSTGRHSAWQSHWLNKGADSVKDVFKCVWCKQSFPTLENLTTHMKETQHMGVNVPPMSDAQRSHHQSQQHNSHHQSGHHSNSNNTSSSTSSSTSKADLNLLIKETMPLPRKLVRGQDVWLGKGAEQTRQILKCMWCGQSFRSLSEMTTHMQQTQHYTNIISQEQIISWKSADDGKGSGGGPGNSGANGAGGASGASSTVSAVLTCKVCDQAFSSLKDLSNHMVKNAHYKEHIMRSISESGGRRRQTREKRKKSLPVRKLLELERAQHEYKNGDTSSLTKSLRDAASGRITCEKCGDKIDTSVFVEHIRQCVGGAPMNAAAAQRNLMKTGLGSNSIIPPDSVSPLTPSSRDGRKSIGDESASPNSRHISPNALSEIASPGSKDSAASSGEKNNSPSVLNAIEQLIEKSFDTRTRHGATGYAGNSQQTAPLGSSILKRLGIDESVDYTKPLIDPQTMNFLRYSQQGGTPFSRRERSGSESSSVSDRGSSRLDSLTPERKMNASNNGSPRVTPDKASQDACDEENDGEVKIKREPLDEDEVKAKGSDEPLNVSIKREHPDDDERSKSIKNENERFSSKRRSSVLSSPSPSPRQSATPLGGHSTPLASPCSDRSATPRSTPGMDGHKKAPTPGGSLGALSSMFDSLTGSGNASNATDSTSQSNNTGKKTSSHPLAALQKLCDKTENSPGQRQNAAGGAASNQNLAVPVSQSPSAGTASGAILAFSWACNDAVMNADSVIKCAFCDTPFSSKGAYRHHLSKVHFVKDDGLLDPILAKAQKQSVSVPRQLTPPSQALSPKSATSSTSSSGNGVRSRSVKSPTPPGVAAPPASASTQQSASGSNFEESPHSKFLKYTELAKQLSSKYV